MKPFVTKLLIHLKSVNSFSVSLKSLSLKTVDYVLNYKCLGQGIQSDKKSISFLHTRTLRPNQNSTQRYLPIQINIQNPTQQLCQNMSGHTDILLWACYIFKTPQRHLRQAEVNMGKTEIVHNIAKIPRRGSRKPTLSTIPVLRMLPSTFWVQQISKHY